MAAYQPRPAAALAALGSAHDEVGQVARAARRGRRRASRRASALGDGDRRLLELCRTLTGRDVEVVAGCAACGELPSVAVLSPRDRSARGAAGGLAGAGRRPARADLRRPAGAAGRPRRGRGGAPRAAALSGRPPRPRGPAELELVDDSLVGPVVLACVECGAALEVAATSSGSCCEGCRTHAGVELEMHLLARAYRWSLATIEALPDVRRSRLARFVADGR